MVLALDLTDDEMLRVEAARQKGIDITALIKGLIAGLPEAHQDSGRIPNESIADAQRRASAIDFLRDSLAVGAIATPEEASAANREVEELKRGLNTNRKATGERPLFPD
jgi:hypothetical protein